MVQKIINLSHSFIIIHNNHQIRFIIGVLRLVGEGLEKPIVTRELLDIKRYTERPTYPMAEPDGLLLYQVEYDDIKFKVGTEKNRFFVNNLICNLFEKQLLKMRLVQAMANNFREKIEQDSKFIFRKIKKVKTKRRKPISEAYKNHLKNKGKFRIRYARVKGKGKTKDKEKGIEGNGKKEEEKIGTEGKQNKEEK